MAQAATSNSEETAATKSDGGAAAGGTGFLLDIIRHITSGAQDIGVAPRMNTVQVNAAPEKGKTSPNPQKLDKTSGNEVAPPAPTPGGKAGSSTSTQSPVMNPLQLIPLLAGAGLSDPLTLATQATAALQNQQQAKSSGAGGKQPGMDGLMNVLGGASGEGGAAGGGMGKTIAGIGKLLAIVGL